MSITSLRAAVTAAGGAPTQYTRVGLLRELITAWGGTPTYWSITRLLRAAITLKGGTPTQFSEIGLLRELITSLTGTPASYNRNALWAQVAGLATTSTPTIGGIAVGAAGTVATIYEGYNLAGGEEFAALDLYKPSNPSGAYIASHRRRGRRAINDAANDYYWSADHTGYRDSNRGVAVGISDLLTQSASVLSLSSRLSTSTEKSNSWTTSASTGPQRPQSSASLHSAGYQAAKWPCIIEARLRVPTGANLPAGGWPAFWMEDVLPTWTHTGEWDFEWKDDGTLYCNFIDDAGNDTNAGTVVDTSDGNWHIFSIVATAATLKFYKDGTLLGTASKRTDSSVTGPMFWWLRIGVDLTPNIYGMTYSTAAWAGITATMDCDYVRVWTAPTATNLGWKGVVQTIDVAFASSFNVTLPSKATLWGGATVTEYLIAQPVEDAEPGTSQVPGSGGTNAWYGQASATNNYWGPTFCAWNAATRAFTGSSFDKSGRMVLHLVAWDDTNGGLAGMARVVVNVGPRVTLASQSWTQNVSVGSVDLYAACDAGMLTTNSGGTKAKTISVTGLPAGVGYSDTTGLITGTPTGTGSGNMAVTVTNSNGQQVTTNVACTVSAAGGTGVVAPTLTGSPTLVASWDFDKTTTLTTSGGSITNISGADGTSFALAQTGTARPTTATRSSKGVALFTRASSQFMSINSALGLTGDATLVIIMEPATVTNSAAILEVSKGDEFLTANRLLLLASATTGYQYRKYDNSSVNSQAAIGSAYTTGVHLFTGYASGGAGQAAKLELDGTATPIVAGTTSGFPVGMAWTMLGGSRQGNGASNTLFYDGYVYRVLIYSAALTATNLEEIAVWAASNYGTPNNA